MMLLARMFPSLYLRALTTEDLQAAYELADRCTYATITTVNRAAYLRMIKSRNRIHEELIRRGETRYK